MYREKKPGRTWLFDANLNAAIRIERREYRKRQRGRKQKRLRRRKK